MTALAQYHAARAALAEATRVDQVLAIRDELEHVKLYAKEIQDRALLADACVFQLRAERRLGEIIVAAKKLGHFKQGRRKGEKTSEIRIFSTGCFGGGRSQAEALCPRTAIRGYS